MLAMTNGRLETLRTPANVTSSWTVSMGRTFTAVIEPILLLCRERVPTTPLYLPLLLLERTIYYLQHSRSQG